MRVAGVSVFKVVQGIGVGLACAVLTGMAFTLGWFEDIELWTLDRRFSVLPRPSPGGIPTNTVIVAVDQRSIEDVYRRNGFRWPWPRAFYGKMIDYLAEAGAKAVVFDMFFTEPDLDRDEISGAESDAALVDATAAAGCVYHAFMLQREGLAPPEDELVALLQRTGRLAPDPAPGMELPVFGSAALPSAALLRRTRMTGYVNVLPERDNIFRRIPLAAILRLPAAPATPQVPFRPDGTGENHPSGPREVVLPGLALAVAWSLEGEPEVALDRKSLHLGRTVVPVDKAARAYLWWYRPPHGTAHTFPRIPAVRVLHSAVQYESGRTPQIGPEAFRDKIVFFASTAPGLHDTRATPLSRVTPGVDIQATALSNLLRGQFVSRLPRWAVLLLLAGFCCVLGAAARGVRHVGPGTVVAVLIVAAVVLAGWWLLAACRLFLDVVPLSAGTLATFLAITYVNYLAERRHAQLVRHIFEHYLDRSVVSSLISNPDRVRLGGERRECSVLFTDVADFTGTAESMQPEQVVQFMNRYLDAMTDIIIEEGGFVDKFVGDEIVAIFGAPYDLPDHAQRACRSVVRMRAKMEELQPSFRAVGCRHTVFARSGIATGELVVGNMGSEARMNYTAMGDVMNLGARLESANKIYRTRILVSDRTAARTAGAFVFREIDRVRVKGKEKPERIHELVRDAGSATSPVDAVIPAFAEALRLYRDARWEEAAGAFEELVRAGDGPSRTLLERCRLFASEAPPEWDGVFVMDVK